MCLNNNAKKGNSFWTTAMSKLATGFNKIGFKKGVDSMTDIGKEANNMGKGLGENFSAVEEQMTGFKLSWGLILGTVFLMFNMTFM